MVKKIFLNQKGAMTIVSLVLLSAIFIIMTGTAGVELLQASKRATEAKEAYNYLIVMEQLGQAVVKARSLGRNNIDCANPIPAAPAGCPAGTVRITWLTPTINATVCEVPATVGPPVTAVPQYSLCVPNRDGDGTAEASDFCAIIDGLNYCLNSSVAPFHGLFFLAKDKIFLGRPPDYVELPGASTQMTDGTTLLPRNNRETWSPSISWPYTNEVYYACGGASMLPEEYWLGCQNDWDPYVERWTMRMCRPSPGAPISCPANRQAKQDIIIYFQNDVN